MDLRIKQIIDDMNACKIGIVLVFITLLAACSKEHSREGLPTTAIDSTYECSGAVVYGEYKAGTSLSTSDSVVMDIAINYSGDYYLQTDTINGVQFWAEGVTVQPGVQHIIFKGRGTPIKEGVYSFSLKGNGCSFSIEVKDSVDEADYVLVTQGDACSEMKLNGEYYLNHTNSYYTIPSYLQSVNLIVDVKSLGKYNMSTDTVNGYYFSQEGIFTKIGVQTVQLNGHGEPLAVGIFTYTPKVNDIHCSFKVEVLPSSISCKINGVPMTFSKRGRYYYTYNGEMDQFNIEGTETYTSNDIDGDLKMSIYKTDKSSVGIGDYLNTEATSKAGNYALNMYLGLKNVQYFSKKASEDTLSPIHIVISKMTDKFVEGTFSGTVRPMFSETPVMQITDGYFLVPQN